MKPSVADQGDERANGGNDQLQHRRTLAVGAILCVVACSIPALATVGGLAALGLVGTVFWGIGGLAIAIAAAIVLFVLRRTRRRQLDSANAR